MPDTTHSPGTTNPPTAKTPWTPERLRALGLTTDVATAAEIFGIGRSTAYDLIRDGNFPLPLLRFGTKKRVPVAAILKALQLDANTPASTPRIAASGPGTPT